MSIQSMQGDTAGASTYASAPPSLKASASLPTPQTGLLSLCDEGGGTCSCRELRAEFIFTTKNLNLPPHADVYQERTHFTTVSSHLGSDFSFCFTSICELKAYDACVYMIIDLLISRSNFCRLNNWIDSSMVGCQKKVGGVLHCGGTEFELFSSVWVCDRAGGRSGGETAGKSIILHLHMSK